MVTQSEQFNICDRAYCCILFTHSHILVCLSASCAYCMSGVSSTQCLPLQAVKEITQFNTTKVWLWPFLRAVSASRSALENQKCLVLQLWATCIH